VRRAGWAASTGSAQAWSRSGRGAIFFKESVKLFPDLFNQLLGLNAKENTNCMKVARDNFLSVQ
jgi:hypothetical protein